MLNTNLSLDLLLQRIMVNAAPRESAACNNGPIIRTYMVLITIWGTVHFNDG